MIQPQEIRIGNNVNTELGIAEVVGIYEDVVDVKGVSVIDNSSENKISISTRSFDGCVEYGKIQPIPLTEEILLKFRYKKIRDNEFLFDNHFIVFIKESEIDFCLFNSEGNDFFVCEIQFAHELQNLHYSIRKEELKFEDIS